MRTLTLLLPALSACSLIPGSHTVSSAAPSTQSAPSVAAVAAPAGDPEGHIAKLLEDGARWSAADVQGKPSMCMAPAGKHALAVWGDTTNARGEHSLDCFAGTDAQLASVTSAQNLREVYDRHIHQTIADDVSTKEPFAIGFAKGPAGGYYWGVELGTTAAVVRIPVKGTLAGSSTQGAIFARFDELADPTAAMANVLAPDRAAAAHVDLAAERTRLVGKLTEAVKAKSTVWAAKDAAALAKVYFPKPTSPEPGVLRAVTAYMKEHPEKTDVDPASIKKIVVTGGAWEIRRDEDKIITGKTHEATVGFVKKDGTCAFVSIQVQKDYAGGGTYNDSIHPNGFQSGWTQILCDRLK